MMPEKIHVGYVCRSCADQWRETYQRHYRSSSVVITCYETDPEDCEDCEGDRASPIRREICSCGCSSILESDL